MYGIFFILLGNLFATFVLYLKEVASLLDAPRRDIIGITMGALGAAVMLEACSRRGGIVVNNVFAILKVLILIAIFVLGYIAVGSHNLSSTHKSIEDFATTKPFSSSHLGVAEYTRWILYTLDLYSGFGQSLFVLKEVSELRRIYSKHTLSVALVISLTYIMVNVTLGRAMFKDLEPQCGTLDTATQFISQKVGAKVAKRPIAVLIACFLALGDIVVIIFTASRVKHDIAKENIVSRYFAPWEFLHPKAKAGFRRLRWRCVSGQNLHFSFLHFYTPFITCYWLDISDAFWVIWRFILPFLRALYFTR
jgi:amino acid transporter